MAIHYEFGRAKLWLTKLTKGEDGGEQVVTKMQIDEKGNSGIRCVRPEYGRPDSVAMKRRKYIFLSSAQFDDVKRLDVRNWPPFCCLFPSLRLFLYIFANIPATNNGPEMSLGSFPLMSSTTFRDGSPPPPLPELYTQHPIDLDVTL